MTDAELTTLLCELLGEIDGWEWRPDGPAYTSSEVGVFYGPIGPAPDRAAGVRVYGGTDDDLEFLRWRRVQVRVRGSRNAPDGADTLADAVFAKLQGNVTTPGISRVSRQSMSPLGADQNGREERTENYLVVLDNPESVV